ncbi:MAG: PDZ domain-containing protein [Gammaproteobacteria bacterium]|nr:PDZ domain-containing protein [Gammaproteobacteria bacterium]
MTKPHRYQVEPANPGAHLFRVTLQIAEPDPSGQLLRLPVWTPGSYKIRDYSRHIVAIDAYADDRELEIVKVDKSSWRLEATQSPVKVVCEIYAWDLSVRGAHLDTTHAYFNGVCVFLSVVGQESRPSVVELLPPPDPFGDEWRVATSMRPLDAGRYGFGTYQVDDYEELIDHPVEMGQLSIGEFDVGGIPHVIAIRGEEHVDMGRICADLARVCGEQMKLFGPPQDLDRYFFLLFVLDNGHGGLEHRWSSSLVCRRSELPRRGEGCDEKEYRDFLGLCSHEYFHLWNVKRMKPEVFVPYDLRTECYTGLLWVFEGVTSYYDDLALVRSGLISTESYLEVLGRMITRVLRTRGRFRQSVEDSSIDAWVKFYQQDANSSNAIVSYYAKGALIALTLDLFLRKETDGACTLDDVMRECWSRFRETGMPERGLESVARRISGIDLDNFFERYVRGTADLPLAELLRDCGIELRLRPAEGQLDKGGCAGNAEIKPASWLGAMLTATGNNNYFSLVHAGSPAEVAGIASGDEAVAFDGRKLTAADLDRTLRDHYPGDVVTISVFRRDEFMQFPVTLAEPPDDTCFLVIDDNAGDVAVGKRSAWMSPPDSK